MTISTEMLSELWRSFFEHNLYRPPDPQDPEHSLPLSTPPYPILIEALGRDYPNGDRAIRVSWWDVTEHHPELAASLVWDLEASLRVARQIAGEWITEADRERVREFARGELELDVVPVGVPPEIYQVPIRQLRQEHLGRAVQIRGVVRKVLPVRPRLDVARFECVWSQHPHDVRQRDIFHLQPPRTCRDYDCKCTDFKLNQEQSSHVDQQKLQIQELPETLPPGAQPETLTVYLEGALVADQIRLWPGDRVVINGILRPRLRYQDRAVRLDQELYLYGVAVEERELKIEDLEPTPEELEQFETLSQRPDLREVIRDAIAPSLYGLLAEKEAVALQLFGGVQKVKPDGHRIRGDMHILLMGDPSTGKSQLIRAVARLAPRCVLATGKSSTVAGLTAAAVRDDFGEGSWSIEAGALVLASGGICCIDELDKMTPEERSAFHEAMEQQTISVNKAGISVVLQAQTSVLAAANPTASSFDSRRPLGPQVNLPSTLLSRFDCFFIVRDHIGGHDDAELASALLQIHRQTDEPESELSPGLLRRYINHARQTVEPLLTDSAALILQSHYLDLRRAQATYQIEDGHTPIMPITPRQLEALIRLSEAAARMRLSPLVEAQDAETAVEVMDHFIQVTLEGDPGLAETGIPMTYRQARGPA